MAKKKTYPSKFETRGKAYIGYAVALKSDAGSEIIIFAPTEDEAFAAAESHGKFNPSRKLIKRCAIVPEASLLESQAGGVA